MQRWRWVHPAKITLLPLMMLVVACASAVANDLEFDETGYQAEAVVRGLENPWALAFLPQQDDDPGSGPGLALVTERPGRLNVLDLDSGEYYEIESGIPEVAAVGQGGLLDVAVHPEYAEGEAWVYLTYAAESDEGGEYATHLGRGRLNIEERALEAFEVLLVAEPFDSNNGHFGSRMVFDQENRLYVTVGDRRDRDQAQDLTNYWGTTVRLEDDGSVPSDNPFVDDDDAHDEIYTYGHRNVQGMAVHPETGDIWQNEHGERDGDEINIIDQPGGNYGWPIATHSREYIGGQPIGDLPEERDDVVNPIYYWDGTQYDDGQEGFAPSGLAFLDGDLFMGNLPYEYLGQFKLEGAERESVTVREERRILGGYGRIRDVRRHPETDDLYVLVDSPDAPVLRVQME